ncbi:MAG: hypothetical protein JSR44_13210 [Spirochaetes bacterium]|nr:hypothetical protein [Spirochaetota bacterium]
MLRLTFASVFLFAPFCLVAAAWEDYGFKVVNSSQEDDKTTLDLNDAEGRSLTVVFTGAPSEQAMPIVAKLQKAFYSWRSMQVKSIRYALLDNSVEVQVFPSAFSEDKVDFMQYIPGHLFFIYKDQLQYSFRLAVNKLFVKIKGYYTDEADLTKKLKQAIKDPQAFIMKRDPEYFIAKLEKLEEEIELQKSATHKQKLEAERLRQVIAALNNTGIFSGPAAIPEKLLKRVVELKTQTPALKREQVQATLDQEKIEWSSKQIKSIFAVYFSEFE